MGHCAELKVCKGTEKLRGSEVNGEWSIMPAMASGCRLQGRQGLPVTGFRLPIPGNRYLATGVKFTIHH
jgi:hypothetical protein